MPTAASPRSRWRWWEFLARKSLSIRAIYILGEAEEVPDIEYRGCRHFQQPVEMWRLRAIFCFNSVSTIQRREGNLGFCYTTTAHHSREHSLCDTRRNPDEANCFLSTHASQPRFWLIRPHDDLRAEMLAPINGTSDRGNTTTERKGLSNRFQCLHGEDLHCTPAPNSRPTYRRLHIPSTGSDILKGYPRGL